MGNCCRLYRNHHFDLITKFDEKELSAAYKLRKVLSDRQHEATDVLLDMMKKTFDNADLTAKVDDWIKISGSKTV